jgi:4-amino-4-deoxy-L-arabinose transferase-like glycosyltransferase
MFTISLTKFHHYVLPCVPPVAMLTGIALDRALPSARTDAAKLGAYLGTMSVSAVLFVYGALRLLGGSPFGSVPEPQSSPWLGTLCVVVAIALFVAAAIIHSPWAPVERSGTLEMALFSCAGLAASGTLLLAGRDLFSPDDAEGPLRLMHLISYNYKRPWPESLDFTSVLAASTLAFAIGCALLSIVRLRAHAATLLLALGVWVAVWGIDVYLVRAAPHWGQRETILEYYRRRSDPSELLVAFQMNWKGENFYTGNHLPAFVSSGAAFRTWLNSEKQKGTRVLFFTTEHSRESGLKSELGKIKRFERLTSKKLNNKFFLARVEL